MLLFVIEAICILVAFEFVVLFAQKRMHSTDRKEPETIDPLS
jgi:hypothetical protein